MDKELLHTEEIPGCFRRVRTQAGIGRVPERSVPEGRQQVRQIEPVLLKNLAKYGYEIYEPSAEELAPFKAKQKGIPDKIAKEMGADGVRLLELIRKTL
mgnify:CR=1 FL=1